MRLSSLFAVLASIVLLVGCDNSGDSTTTSPTTPVLLKTETFSGTVDPMGSDFKPFTLAQAGEVDVTLTAAGPPSTIFMGIGVGTPTTDSSSCTLDTRFTVAVPASTTPQIGPLTAGAGIYCFKVFDVGNQTATVNYTVTVAHP